MCLSDDKSSRSRRDMAAESARYRGFPDRERGSSTLLFTLLAGIMNNRPVEQALAKLLPTHANDLPEELLSLSLSLVAQSRSFSTSLRPEEEIARPYACAELACKR